MPSSELLIEQQHAPLHAYISAKSIARRGIAARVVLRPSDEDSSWIIDAKGPRTGGKQGPPEDIPKGGWDSSTPPADRGRFQDFSDFVESATDGVRSSMGTSYNSPGSDYWNVFVEIPERRG